MTDAENSAQEPGTPQGTYNFPTPQPSGRILTPILVDATKTYDVRRSVEVTTKDRQSLATSGVGVAVVSAVQKLGKRFGR
jgi:hypothetical protein